jgi:hypothetical protein
MILVVFLEKFQTIIDPLLADPMLDFDLVNAWKICHPHDTRLEIVDFGVEGLVSSELYELENIFDVGQELLVGVILV